MNTGYKFEQYCTNLYKSMGKIAVTHNIQYNFRRVIGKQLIRKAQVDIEYVSLPLSLTTVECKYRKDVNVGPEEVESFIETLRMLERDGGVMITNKEYTSTAAKIARRGNIKLIDHDKLIKMYKQSLGIRGIFSAHCRGLEQLIRETRLDDNYLNPKIRTEYVLF